nr:uncharacterized protein LOC106842501 isoform X1 [Equus asinus]
MAARQHQLRRNSPPPPPPPPPPARRGPARKEKTIYPSLSLCCFLAYITINARPFLFSLESSGDGKFPLEVLHGTKGLGAAARGVLCTATGPPAALARWEGKVQKI